MTEAIEARTTGQLLSTARGRVTIAAKRSAEAGKAAVLDESAKRAAGAALRNLREAVLSGQSTGDLALDLQIAVEGRIELGENHRALVGFMAKLAQHPGELIVVFESSDRSPSLGVLATPAGVEPPDTHQWGGADRSSLSLPCTDFVHSPDAHVQTDRSAFVRYQAPIMGLVYEPGSSLNPKKAVVVIGNADVQAWLEHQTGTEANRLAKMALMLGRNLRRTEAMWEESRKEREALLEQLIPATSELNQLLNHLRSLQHDPASALEANRYLTRKPTPTGVTIDFGLSDKIEEAASKLRKHVKKALDELEMGENAAVRAAIRTLERVPQPD